MPENQPVNAESDVPSWIEGWVAAMDWLAEWKGSEGIALAQEMATRLPEHYVTPPSKGDAYDWTMDDTLTREEVMERFNALGPEPTRGPRDTSPVEHDGHAERLNGLLADCPGCVTPPARCPGCGHAPHASGLCEADQRPACNCLEGGAGA